jgi:hypothetical protein
MSIFFEKSIKKVLKYLTEKKKTDRIRMTKRHFIFYTTIIMTPEKSNNDLAPIEKKDLKSVTEDSNKKEFDNEMLTSHLKKIKENEDRTKEKDDADKYLEQQLDLGDKSSDTLLTEYNSLYIDFIGTPEANKEKRQEISDSLDEKYKEYEEAIKKGQNEYNNSEQKQIDQKEFNSTLF